MVLAATQEQQMCHDVQREGVAKYSGKTHVAAAVFVPFDCFQDQPERLTEKNFVDSCNCWKVALAGYKGRKHSPPFDSGVSID